MLGDVPVDWSTVRLSELAARVQRKVSGTPDDVLMITSGSGFVAQSDKYSRFMAGESLKTYTELRRGEFAYNKGNSKAYPYGCVFQLADYESAAVPSVYISFRIDDARLDRRFASHFFLARGLDPHLSRVITSGVRGNGLLNISPDAFFDAPVPLPPLPEQKKIAAILSSVDEAIQATQAVIDQTRRVKEGLLQDLLTRGIGHTRFKQTEIGEIPEGWEVRALEEVCGRVGVGIASSATHAYRDTGVPLIRNQNIKYGYLDLSDLLYVDEAYDLENQTKRIHTGDVLTIRTGYPGVSAVVPPELNNAQSFTTLVSTPKPGVIRSQFLAAWINGPVGRRLVLAGEAGGAQHNLNAGELKRLPVPVPPLGEQDGIMSVLQSVSATEVMENEATGRLARAKNGLLTDLLTGKVRVTP